MSKRESSRGEQAAWKQLRLLRHEGFAFRREHEIGSYRVDFVCLRARVIVECDGGVHALPGRAERDAERDEWLEAEGYKVLRFTDAHILSEANWLNEVRQVLLKQPEANYRWKTAPLSPRKASLPLEGGEGGEGVRRRAPLSNAHANNETPSVDLTLPQPPPLQGGGS